MSDLTDPPETETTTTASDASDASSEEGDSEALDRAAESIREAKDAEGDVAASDDIRTRDDDLAGVNSEDPDGEGGHP